MQSSTTTLQAIIESLKRSPVFNLSLASKELFHSNFLAWLCETYPQHAGAFFAKFLRDQPSSCDGLKVYRELKNIDLTLEYPHGERLIVEIKVKSMPSRAQLEEYAAEIKDKDRTSFLLISLARPTFALEGASTFALDDRTQWQLLTYRDLAIALESMQPSIVTADTYHGQLVADYFNVIRQLDALQTHFHVALNDDDPFFCLLDDLKSLKAIRLHDLVDKLRYDQLAEEVSSRLAAARFQLAHGNFMNGIPGHVFVSSGMTRGTGLLDCKYVLERIDDIPIVLGIQVQGRSFRLHVEMWDKNRCERLAKELLTPGDGDKRIWFDFCFAPQSENERPPDPSKFNQYSGWFYYRSRTLLDVSANHIVASVVRYVLFIRENEEALKRHVVRGLAT